MISITNM